MNNETDIKNAIDLLNDNNYIVIPITKGQVFLCDECRQDETECRFSTLGYTCSNIVSINSLIKDQLDMKKIMETQ